MRDLEYRELASEWRQWVMRFRRGIRSFLKALTATVGSMVDGRAEGL